MATRERALPFQNRSAVMGLEPHDLAIKAVSLSVLFGGVLL